MNRMERLTAILMLPQDRPHRASLRAVSVARELALGEKRGVLGRELVERYGSG